MKITTMILLVLLGTGAVFAVAGQTRGKPKPRRNLLPRVGKIQNPEDVTKYITGGCDYHIVNRRGDPVSPPENIFVSNTEGLLAVMNLDGEDVRLELVKTTLWYESTGNARARLEYRAGKTRIVVSYWQLSDYISDYPVKIVLRKGKATRTIRAVGEPLCDAI